MDFSFLDFKSPFILGLSIGIVGAFHCVGMCGPLVMALPLGKLEPWRRGVYVFTYHIMRIVAYLTLAFLVFMLKLPFIITHFFGFLSFFFGVFLLFVSLFQWMPQLKFSAWIRAQISNIYQHWMQQPRSLLKIGGLGFINGWIPCGLTYSALASSLLYPSLDQSLFLMLGFGVGVFPILFFTTWFGQALLKRFGKYQKYLSQIILILVALMLIYRGLQMEFFSKRRPQEVPEKIHCK
jgi:sulfite exporter TauE/SafE